MSKKTANTTSEPVEASVEWAYRHAVTIKWSIDVTNTYTTATATATTTTTTTTNTLKRAAGLRQLVGALTGIQGRHR